MKKIRYLQVVLSFFLLGTVSASAQEAVNVSKADGSVVSAKLDNMRKITFSVDEATMTIFSLDGATTDVALVDVSTITFGEYQSTSNGIATPQKTEFSVMANGVLYISCPDGIKNVIVYDTTGKILYEAKVDACDFKLDLSLLCSGICVIKVHTAAAIVTQKITIK